MRSGSWTSLRRWMACTRWTLRACAADPGHVYAPGKPTNLANSRSCIADPGRLRGGGAAAPGGCREPAQGCCKGEGQRRAAHVLAVARPAQAAAQGKCCCFQFFAEPASSSAAQLHCQGEEPRGSAGVLAVARPKRAAAQGTRHSPAFGSASTRILAWGSVVTKMWPQSSFLQPAEPRNLQIVKISASDSVGRARTTCHCRGAMAEYSGKPVCRKRP